MAWTDEKKQEVIQEYVAIMENEYKTDEERAASTVEVTKELADKYGETVNGVRFCLSKAGVYIKATSAKKAKAASDSASGAKRVNKAEAHAELARVISAIDPELVDNEQISKLTGKAAQYFSGIIVTVTSKGE